MPFLTKGKTNWKYILIVLILAAIVGGGILIFNWGPEIVKFIRFQKAKTPEEKCKIAGDVWIPSKNCCCPAQCLTTIYPSGKEPPECLCCHGLYEELEETANWKTYRNDEYGFEIKYPPDWEIVHEDEFSVEFHSVAEWEGVSEASLFITPIWVKQDSNFEKVVEDFRQLLRSLEQEKKEAFEEKEILLGGRPAFLFTRLSKFEKELDKKSWSVKEVYIYEKSKMLKIYFSVQPYEGIRISKYDFIFNQMLSTFRFLE
jgi:hypothetical protein